VVPEGSLLHLQVPKPVPTLRQINPVHTPHPIARVSILILSYHLRLCLPSYLFPSGFPTKTLYAPLLVLHAPPISLPTNATCNILPQINHINKCKISKPLFRSFDKKNLQFSQYGTLKLQITLAQNVTVRQNWRMRKMTTNVTILVRSPEGATMARQDRLSSKARRQPPGAGLPHSRGF
jgi:hypothetical protein